MRRLLRRARSPATRCSLGSMSIQRFRIGARTERTPSVHVEVRRQRRCYAPQTGKPPELEAEVRADPEDGSLLTKAEFLEKYSGFAQWDAASGKKGGKGEKCDQSPMWSGQRCERRRDPADNRWYKKDEFMSHYNGYAEWDAAAPAGSGRAEGRSGRAEGRSGRAEGRSGRAEGRSGRAEGKSGRAEGRSGKGTEWMATPVTAKTQAAPAEVRIDVDGIAYTREAFVQAYGGTAEWEAAGRVGMPKGCRPAKPSVAAARRRDKSDGRFYTNAQFIAVYGVHADLIWDHAEPEEVTRPAHAGTGAGRGGSGSRAWTAGTDVTGSKRPAASQRPADSGRGKRPRTKDVDRASPARPAAGGTSGRAAAAARESPMATPATPEVTPADEKQDPAALSEPDDNLMQGVQLEDTSGQVEIDGFDRDWFESAQPPVDDVIDVQQEEADLDDDEYL
eukprot:TRINITY_DN9514_c0_g1_i1.p1 TRINITY_DN9514_c0_g1~~TRINITY_DN9514_c0_g1_i1.p1  ORF type:complete len:448 (+),score=108.14 TRINITY_DN9514_c0_g1_i1:209-1552(+)